MQIVPIALLPLAITVFLSVFAQAAAVESDAAADQLSAATRLEGPTGIAIKYSQDGRWLMTAGADAAQVWDAQTLRPRGRAILAQGQIIAASLSSSGQWLAVACGSKVAVWDSANTDQAVVTLPHPIETTGVEFSDDCRLLATTARDRVARVWEVSTGKLLWAFPHDGEVAHAVFGSGSTLLLTSVYFGGSSLWDLKTGKASANFSGTAAVRGSPAAFSPSNDRVVTAEFDRACIWSANTGKKIAQTLPPGAPQREPLGVGQVNRVVFSPDGKRLLTAGMGGARIWDAQSGKPLGSPMVAQWMERAEFSPDGSYILTVDKEVGMRMWDDTGEVVLHAPITVASRGPSVATFNRSGTQVAFAIAAEGITYLWSIEPRK